jgi:integrase
LPFCQPNGDYYSPDHVGTRTKALLRKTGYPDFSLHSLRHPHASILLGNGTPLAMVSERLGHANQDSTFSLYSHSLPADRKAASRVWHRALAEVLSLASIDAVFRACRGFGPLDVRTEEPS